MAVSGLGSHNPYINASNSANSSQSIKPRHHHDQDDDDNEGEGEGHTAKAARVASRP